MARESGLYDYWMVLYSRRLFILIASFSAALFALLISLFFDPVFERNQVLFASDA